MAYTTIPTIVTGDVATAAWGNTYLKNNFAATAVGVVTTAGDIVHATAANVLARLAIGSANQLLRVNAGATAPEWASTLSGLTLTAPDINGGTADSLTSLSIRSTGAAFDLIITTPSVLTADRILTITPGDAARTITLSGNPTLADWFDQAVKAASSPTFANLTITSPLATLKVQDDALQIENPAATFKYTLTGAAIAADRVLTLPLLTAGGTLGVIANGSYTGDNTADRAITHGLGITPKAVFIHPNGGGNDFSMFGAQTILTFVNDASSGGYNVTGFSATTFSVGNAGSYPNSANASGVVYHWVAFG